MRARYYNSRIGRFISRDPRGGINLYEYAKNNPVNKIDPTGLCECGETPTFHQGEYWACIAGGNATCMSFCLAAYCGWCLKAPVTCGYCTLISGPLCAIMCGKPTADFCGELAMHCD